MYSTAVNGVIHAFLGDDPRVRRFRSSEGVAHVVCAVDVGACRLVPLHDHAVRLVDEPWGIELGVELTAQGERAAASLVRTSV